MIFNKMSMTLTRANTIRRCAPLVVCLCVPASCSPAADISAQPEDMSPLDMKVVVDHAPELVDMGEDAGRHRADAEVEDASADQEMGDVPYAPPALTDEQQESFDLILQAFKEACELEQRCLPVLFAQSHTSVDDCVRYSSDRSYLRHEMTSVSVTPAQVHACIAQWEGAQCSDLHLLNDIGYMESCLFTGSKMTGDRCYHHMACESGYCDYSFGAEDSCAQVTVCLEPVEDGERACGPGVWSTCPPRMDCIRVGVDYKCRKPILAHDSSVDCRTHGNDGAGVCDGRHLFCDREDGLCKPYAQEGESCQDVSCLIGAQLNCPHREDNPVCKKIPDEEWFLPEGAPCTHKDYLCTPGTLCAGQFTSYCQSPLEEGDPCERGDPCPSGTLCNTELGVCETRGFTAKCLEPVEPQE